MPSKFKCYLHSRKRVLCFNCFSLFYNASVFDSRTIRGAQMKTRNRCSVYKSRDPIRRGFEPVSYHHLAHALQRLDTVLAKSFRSVFWIIKKGSPSTRQAQSPSVSVSMRPRSSPPSRLGARVWPIRDKPPEICGAECGHILAGFRAIFDNYSSWWTLRVLTVIIRMLAIRSS